MDYSEEQLTREEKRGILPRIGSLASETFYGFCEIIGSLRGKGENCVPIGYEIIAGNLQFLKDEVRRSRDGELSDEEFKRKLEREFHESLDDEDPFRKKARQRREVEGNTSKVRREIITTYGDKIPTKGEHDYENYAKLMGELRVWENTYSTLDEQLGLFEDVVIGANR